MVWPVPASANGLDMSGQPYNGPGARARATPATITAATWSQSTGRQRREGRWPLGKRSTAGPTGPTVARLTQPLAQTMVAAASGSGSAI